MKVAQFEKNPDTLLIDGDLLAFQVCAAAEYGKEPEEVDVDSIIRSTVRKINNIKAGLGANHVIIMFSHENNFRYGVEPQYKINRKETWRTSDGWMWQDKEVAKLHQTVVLKELWELKHAPPAWKPYNLKNVFGYLKGVFPSVCMPGLEADDLLKVYQTNTTCIVTIDKDLLQCQGMHYRWETNSAGEQRYENSGSGTLELHLKVDEKTTKGQKAIASALSVTPDIIIDYATIKNPKKEVKGSGPIWFLYQCLIGDPTDGIPGCGKTVKRVAKTGVKAGQVSFVRSGIGPVEAYKLLHPYQHSYAQALRVVIHQYKLQFGDEWSSKLLKVGRCVFMVKEVDDYGRSRMWHYDPKATSVWYDPDCNLFLHPNGRSVIAE